MAGIQKPPGSGHLTHPQCDESHPGCSQCLKLGLCCPGPRMGAFFVHALPGSTTLTKPTAEQTPLDLTASIVAGKHCWLTRNQYVAPRLPSCHQPSRADLFDQLFVSHFIESFGFRESSDERTPSTWLDSLALFITSPSQDLVKTSIRAGSMFFYGSLVDDVSIRTEANKWYVKALQGLRCLLTQQASEFTGDVICSAVMLAHYETTAGTSDEAWFQHVQGAARMLQSGGPASCRDGFLHQLFRHLRLLAVSKQGKLRAYLWQTLCADTTCRLIVHCCVFQKSAACLLFPGMANSTIRNAPKDCVRRVCGYHAHFVTWPRDGKRVNCLH